MRSTLVIAAFVASALAVPYNKEHRRDVVTAWDYVTVNKYVTVTAGQEPAPTPEKEKKKTKHHGHHHHKTYTTVHTTPSPAPPSYEAPDFQAPKQEAPKVEVPKVEAPKVEAPSYSTPSNNQAPDDYAGLCVYHHNLHRANHTVADVAWDPALAATAKTIAESCVYAHNTEVDGGGYGQNIAAGVDAANISAIITDLFYNGEEPYFSDQYGKDDPDMSQFELWGHFSQIVWKGTTHIGCATVQCPNGLANTGSGVEPVFTVCNYKNPGNYAGEYGSNVLKPQGHASASWRTGSS